MMKTTFSRMAAGAAALAACAAVAGCGMAGGTGGGTGSTTTPLVVTKGGRVMGGQQPVSGATIQLYVVNQTGSKLAATPLITGAPITTDGNGNWSDTGRYTCPTGGTSYVYLLATGGNPGLSGTVNNTKIALMAGLGACSTLEINYPYVVINELTTVASVYALAGFMADATHVGASAANTQGLANAFGTITNLVNIAAGTAPGPTLPVTSTAPSAELNTLANVLANCVNTDGTGSPCATLISGTTPPGGTAATDTVGALLNVVRNPTNNVSGIFNQSSAVVPFAPTLSTAPADWTVAVKSTGGGLSAPGSLAIDATGNVWVANSSGTTVTELNNAQGLVSGTTGYAATGLLGPQGIAIDTGGHAWIASTYGNSVIELGATGTALSPSGGYQSAGISSPVAVAIDTNNNVWIANYNGNSVSGLNASANPATPISGSPFTASSTIARPAGVAIDPNSNVWVTNSGGTSVTELSSAGAALSGAGYNDGVVQEPVGVAIDSTGRAYVAGNGGNSLDVFSSAGASAAMVSTGLSLPTGVATDAANASYTTNGVAAGSLVVLGSLTGTPVAVGSLNAPLAVAVDESGNVWTANSGDNSVTEFVGLGTPTRTPLAYEFSAF